MRLIGSIHQRWITVAIVCAGLFAASLVVYAFGVEQAKYAAAIFGVAAAAAGFAATTGPHDSDEQASHLLSGSASARFLFDTDKKRT